MYIFVVYKVPLIYVFPRLQDNVEVGDFSIDISVQICTWRGVTHCVHDPQQCFTAPKMMIRGTRDWVCTGLVVRNDVSSLVLNFPNIFQNLCSLLNGY